MIINFFNKTKPINLVFLSGLLIIIRFSNNFIYNEGLLSLNLFLETFILSISLFLFNHIVFKNSLTSKSDFGILIYVFLIGFFFLEKGNESILFSHFFLLLAYQKIYQLNSEINTKSILFDSGFWLGIAGLFYPQSSFFILLVLIALLVNNKMNWRNFLMPFLGFSAPIFIFYTYLFFTNQLHFFNEIISFITSYDYTIYNTILFLIPIIYFIFLIIWSIITISNKQSQESIEFRINWILVVVHFLIALIIVLTTDVKNGSEMLFLFFPVSIIIANHLRLLSKKWLKRIVLYTFIFLLILMKFL